MPQLTMLDGEPKRVEITPEDDDRPFDLEYSLQTLAHLTQQKRELEEQVEALSKSITDYQDEAIEYITSHSGIKPPFHVEFGGFKATISLNTRKVWGAANEGNWQEVKEALIEEGWDDVVRPQSQALTGKLNELEGAGDEIPAAILAVVKRKDIVTLKVVGIKPA